jgi:NAD(P)-dependent dehydrogenase (short-subunit alcohol dehydrogenase family)
MRATAERVTEAIDLTARHALVTGANTGIGLETTRVLALRGCRVTMACRSTAKASAARDRLLAADTRLDPERLHVRALDLASLDAVRAFARAWLPEGRPLHLLVNNAGVMLPDRRLTHDGFEGHLGINHLGHFLLTTLLLDRLRESAPARIVNVASDAMHWGSLDVTLTDLNWERRRFRGMRAYGDSKLMNLLFTDALNRRLAADRVVSYALHPGVVRTELARDQPWWMLPVGFALWPFMKNVAQGAATTLHVATAPALETAGPHTYFADCAPNRRPRRADDPEFAARLWQRSLELVGA